MTDRKGFTLIEIIVTLVIIGVLTAIAVNCYTVSIQQAAANAAQNNLITIYGAQRNYYFTNGSYCTAAGSCDTLANLNTNLKLNITDSNYTYACCTDASGFLCQASNGTTTCAAMSGNTQWKMTYTPIVPLTNPKCTGTYCPT